MISDRQAPSRTRPKPAEPRLYLVLRFWHRWASLLTAPFLLIISLTGALLVFHDSLDHWFRPGTNEVQPSGSPVSIQTAIDQVEGRVEGWVSRVTIPARDDRPWNLLVSPVGSRWANLRIVLYDPYTAQVMENVLQKDTRSAFVTGLHRRLLAGKPGQFLVEITTCWTIITVILGVALWWPKKWSRMTGNWLPQIGGSLKRQVRDWHAVAGAWFTVAALVFMLTGLFFSPVWGRYIGRHLMAANAVFYQNVPASDFSGDQPPGSRIPVDEALRQAETAFAFRGHDFFISIPGFKKESYRVSTHWENPFHPRARVIVHAWSGEVLQTVRPADLPLNTRAAMLVGPTHVGSVLGWPGRIIALLTCLVLAALAVTGLWLWLKAPPLGPVRARAFLRYPWSLKAGILVLGLAFPLAGLTLLAVWLGRTVVFLASSRLRSP